MGFLLAAGGTLASSFTLELESVSPLLAEELGARHESLFIL